MEEMQMALIADMGASLELGRHREVHGDHDLLLLSHQHVTFFHLFMDPVLEIVSKDSSMHINNPLLRDLPQVGLVGLVHVHLPLVAHVVEDLLE